MAKKSTKAKVEAVAIDEVGVMAMELIEALPAEVIEEVVAEVEASPEVVEEAVAAIEAALPKAGDGHIDQRGIALADADIVETELGRASGTEIVDDDICAARERQSALLSVRLLEVQACNFLAPCKQRVLQSAFAVGLLYFQDLGSLIGQQHRRNATRPTTAEIQDANTLQRSGPAFHAHLLVNR
jgi:hypothetical protein